MSGHFRRSTIRRLRHCARTSRACSEALRTLTTFVQDAYLRLLRAPPATEDVQQLRALLFRIASNLMVDYWRQRQRERLAPEDRAIATTSDPDAALRVDMARTFGQLKPQQRQLLWMAYVEGADHREIAIALGLHERSVRVLLHRARQKLARLLVRSGRGEREC
jgi:RNA polymerase sigma-70 factor (ECF subfamily)